MNLTMRKTKIYLTVLAGLLSGQLWAQSENDKIILKAMQDELNRNKKELSLADFGKPFFISYALGQSKQFEVSGSLGAVKNSYESSWSSVGSVRLLLGDYQWNSEPKYMGQFVRTGMPAEADYNEIRRNFWLCTDDAYKYALQNFAGKQAYLKSNPQTEEEAGLADLSKVEPITKIVENNTKYVFDKKQWEENIRELSAIFKNYKDLFNTNVSISGMEMEVYKATSEDVVVKQPVNYVGIFADATVRTDDGVKFGDRFFVLAATPQDLPSMEELKTKITEFAENLEKLRAAEPITEYYSGPILFEDAACANIFTSNLLNQGGLFAYRKPDMPGQQAKRTIENRMGKKIVDTRISVKNYSTLPKYNNTSLIGAYQVDAEGVVPQKELTLVENGILKNMLNGRIPTLKTPNSTGSSKYLLNGNEVMFATAPGTIHVAVKDGTKPEKMKNALMKAAKEEGLDYAYIVRKMAGQASLIYKVGVKDGRETLVRAGDFSPVDLAKIKRVLDISSKENVSNYILNQQVLSSLIYPSSIIIEDMEINKSELKKEKAPALQLPLQRAQK